LAKYIDFDEVIHKFAALEGFPEKNRTD